MHSCAFVQPDGKGVVTCFSHGSHTLHSPELGDILFGDNDRALREALLEAAIEWHKMPIHPTVAEAMLLEPLEREILAQAFDIVHGYDLHPDAKLDDAVRGMAGAA